MKNIERLQLEQRSKKQLGIHFFFTNKVNSKKTNKDSSSEYVARKNTSYKCLPIYWDKEPYDDSMKTSPNTCEGILEKFISYNDLKYG